MAGVAVEEEEEDEEEEDAAGALLEEDAAEEDDEEDAAAVSGAGPSVCADVASVACASESSCMGLPSCGSAVAGATAAGPTGDDADEDIRRKDWKRR
jgi:hypothetical protein